MLKIPIFFHFYFRIQYGFFVYYLLVLQVHCGFIHNSGAEMARSDIKYVKKCTFVVASGIFDGYDTPHQPSNISLRSKKLFCFLMVVDEISLKFIKENVTIREDDDGGKWVGIWRLVLLKHPPYDEPRRNGKIPKILLHRLFPQAQYSIWIDGKMELIVDPLLILERYVIMCVYVCVLRLVEKLLYILMSLDRTLN